ncbi:MAG: hypothetical protein RBU37_11100 [Myxococcota bacterium]|jgi:hypothetical protein|nr:hypothetical protein [Myxococcota bacterium]
MSSQHNKLELLPHFERFLRSKSVSDQHIIFYRHVFTELTTFLSEPLESAEVDEINRFLDAKIESGLSAGKQKAYHVVLEHVLEFREHYLSNQRSAEQQQRFSLYAAGELDDDEGDEEMPGLSTQALNAAPLLGHVSKVPFKNDKPARSFIRVQTKRSSDRSKDNTPVPEEWLSAPPSQASRPASPPPPAGSDLSSLLMGSEADAESFAPGLDPASLFDDALAAVDKGNQSAAGIRKSAGRKTGSRAPNEGRHTEMGRPALLSETLRRVEQPTETPLFDAGPASAPAAGRSTELGRPAMSPSSALEQAVREAAEAKQAATRSQSSIRPPTPFFDQPLTAEPDPISGPPPGANLQALFSAAAPPSNMGLPPPPSGMGLPPPPSNMGLPPPPSGMGMQPPSPFGLPRPPGLSIPDPIQTPPSAPLVPSTGLGEDEKLESGAVAFSKLGMLGGDPNAGGAIALSDDDEAEQPVRANSADPPPKKKGPGLRSVSMPSRPSLPERPKVRASETSADDIKRLQQRLERRFERVEADVVKPRLDSFRSFRFEGRFRIDQPAPSGQFVAASGASSRIAGTLTSSALFLLPAALGFFFFTLGLLAQLNLLASLQSLKDFALPLIGMGAVLGGIFGFPTFKLLSRGLPPLMQHTPQAVFATYHAALWSANWGAAMSCLALSDQEPQKAPTFDPRTERAIGQDFNHLPLRYFEKYWSVHHERRLLPMFGRLRAAINPPLQANTRIAAGSVESGSVLLLLDDNNQATYRLIPVIRLGDKWFITDGQLFPYLLDEAQGNPAET